MGRIQLNQLSCDGCEDTCTLFYHYHQIGSMAHLHCLGLGREKWYAIYVFLYSYGICKIDFHFAAVHFFKVLFHIWQWYTSLWYQWCAFLWVLNLHQQFCVLQSMSLFFFAIFCIGDAKSSDLTNVLYLCYYTYIVYRIIKLWTSRYILSILNKLRTHQQIRACCKNECSFRNMQRFHIENTIICPFAVQLEHCPSCHP